MSFLFAACRPVARAALAVCLVFAVAACGRSGAPLTPTQAANEAASANPDAPAPTTPQQRDRDFILDPLLN